MEQARGDEGGQDRPLETEVLDDELQDSGVGTTVAVVVAALGALLLLALPAAVALQGSALVGEWVVLCLGGFAVATLCLKLAAIAWGVAKQLYGEYSAGVVTENAD